MGHPLGFDQELINVQLRGLRDWLDDGPDAACIEIYGGAWPGSGLAGEVLLATIILAKPCGAVANGELTLVAAKRDGDVVTETGEALWGRLKTAAGAYVMDGAITVAGGTSEAAGFFEFSDVEEGPNKGALLYIGGRLPPVSLVLYG